MLVFTGKLGLDPNNISPTPATPVGRTNKQSKLKQSKKMVPHKQQHPYQQLITNLQTIGMLKPNFKPDPDELLHYANASMNNGQKNRDKEQCAISLQIIGRLFRLCVNNSIKFENTNVISEIFLQISCNNIISPKIKYTFAKLLLTMPNEIKNIKYNYYYKALSNTLNYLKDEGQKQDIINAIVSTCQNDLNNWNDLGIFAQNAMLLAINSVIESTGQQRKLYLELRKQIFSNIINNVSLQNTFFPSYHLVESLLNPQNINISLNEEMDKILFILMQKIENQQIVLDNWPTNKINTLFNNVTNIIHKSNREQTPPTYAKKATQIRQRLFKYMINKIENEEKPNEKTIALSTTLVSPFSLSLNSDEEKNRVLYIFLQQIVECELEPNAYAHYATRIFPRATIALMKNNSLFTNKHSFYILKATMEALAKINHPNAKHQICELTNFLMKNIHNQIIRENSNITILSLDLLMTSIQNIQRELNGYNNFLKHNSKKISPQQITNMKKHIGIKHSLIKNCNQTVLELLNWYKSQPQKTRDLTTAFIACLTGIFGCSSNAIIIFNEIITLSEILPQKNSIYFDNAFTAIIRQSTNIKTPEMISKIEKFKVSTFKDFEEWKKMQTKENYQEFAQICKIAIQFSKENESFCRFLNVEANFFHKHRVDNTFIDAIENSVKEHSGRIASCSSLITTAEIIKHSPHLMVEVNKEEIQKGEKIRQEITTNINQISDILSGNPQLLNYPTHILINIINQSINAIRKSNLIDLTAATGHDNETILEKIRDIIMLKKRLEQPNKQMVNIYNLNPNKLIINNGFKINVIAANKKILHSIKILNKSNHFYTSVSTFLNNLEKKIITDDFDLCEDDNYQQFAQKAIQSIYKISNYLIYYIMIKQHNNSKLIAQDLFQMSHLGEKPKQASKELEKLISKIESFATEKQKKESQSYDAITLFFKLKTFIFEVMTTTFKQQNTQPYNIHVFGKIFGISDKLQQHIRYPKNQKYEISPVNTIETIIETMNNEEIIINYLYNDQHTQEVIKSMMLDFDKKIETKTNEISNQIDKVENLALGILQQRVTQRAQELVLKERIREILTQSNLLAKTEDVLPQTPIDRYIVPPPPPLIPPPPNQTFQPNQK